MASARNRIDKDSKYINELVLSARKGNWQRVFDILGPPDGSNRSGLINVIPENRRWAILHQAVYWGNPGVLKSLLRYDGCDIDTKAKLSSSECGSAFGLTAEEISHNYGHFDLERMLAEHDNVIHQQSVPTFLPVKGYTHNKGLGLITVTLAAYKNAFHPKPIDKDRDILSVLKDIFDDIMTNDHRWRKIKEKVCDTVMIVSYLDYERMKDGETREDFLRAVINTYSQEENRMYTYLNTAFRRQKLRHYRPTGDDLAFGPYAVVYQMLLLFWRQLPRESNLTYRKVLLNDYDINKYQIGTRFVWQSITSSSIDINLASAFPTHGPEGNRTVCFTIDNSARCIWQPRNIEMHAQYPVERERTYPAGAKFEIVDGWEDGNDVYFNLQLLPK